MRRLLSALCLSACFVVACRDTVPASEAPAPAPVEEAVPWPEPLPEAEAVPVALIGRLEALGRWKVAAPGRDAKATAEAVKLVGRLQGRLELGDLGLYGQATRHFRIDRKAPDETALVLFTVWHSTFDQAPIADVIAACEPGYSAEQQAGEPMSIVSMACTAWFSKQVFRTTPARQDEVVAALHAAQAPALQRLVDDWVKRQAR